MSYLSGLLTGPEAEKAAKQELQRQKIVSEGMTAYQDHFEEQYPALGKGFEGNIKEQQIAACTALVMRNQKEFLENITKQYGETTVINSLGQMAPRIIDVVRIFFPNLIANMVAEIQTLDRQSGEVLTVKPRYTNTGGGVNAGEEVFVNPTDGAYASDTNLQNIGTGDGATTAFPDTLSTTPIRPGTVSILNGGVQVGTDDGDGVMVGEGGSGTVNYGTGAFSFTFTTAPTNGNAITVQYRFDVEQTPDSIREMDIGINLVPIQTQPHPLRVKYSVQAQLAATAQYNLDVEDTVSNLAAQFIRKERDFVIVQKIAAAATANTDLDFDATVPGGGGLTRKQHFQDWGLKLARAESLIFNKNGRGNVSFVLCGINASDVISSQANFVS